MSRPSALIGALAAAFVAVAALAAPAAYATGTEPTDRPHGEDANGTITWMVRPSDGLVEDGRSWMELDLDAGESAVEHLLVRNLSAETVTFALSAADGYFTDTGRFNMLTSGEVSTGAGTWIELQDSVEVPSGAEVIVPFTVTVPDDTEPGDHPAGVAASIRSGGDAEVGIESRVGFRVMTRVTGQLTPALATSVSAQYIGSPNPFEPGSAQLTYEVRNAGNTRLAVDPSVTLAGPAGMFARSVTLEPIAEIAPGETRVIEHQVSRVWPLGALAIDSRAEATVVVDATSAPPATASTVIAAVPWSQAGIIAAVVLLLVAVRAGHRRRTRKVAQMIEQARSEGRAEAAGPAGESAQAGAGSVPATGRPFRSAAANGRTSQPRPMPSSSGRTPARPEAG